jgi:Cysteine-rich secretory protein family
VRNRRLIVAIALVVLASSSCSVRQVQAWFAVHQRPVPSTADALVLAQKINAIAPLGCDDNYADACVPDNVLAVHCAGDDGVGPAVQGPFRVVAWDHFGLDPDADKIACEGPVPVVQPAGVAGGSAADAAWARSMLDRVNGERANAGLPPLQSCSELDRSAQIHSADQAAHNTMTHTGSDGSTPSSRAAVAGYAGLVGENIATGYPDVPSVLAAWTGSADHRSNIVGNYTHIGLGRAASASGQLYWTQDFGVGGVC